MPSERREVLHIEEEVEEEKEDPMSQSDSSSLLAEAEAVSRIVTVQLERVQSVSIQHDFFQSHVSTIEVTILSRY